MPATINKSSLDFLRKLSKNNNRDWFNRNKSQYTESQENVTRFLDDLIEKMNLHDQLETPSGKKSLYWIHNDVRFAKNKSPYNPRFAAYLRRSKPMLRGGYYIWIAPGASRVGCGFSYPNSQDLNRIRLDIDRNYEEWNSLLASKSITTSFGKMQGEKVKTAPRGFPKDHPAIDLLRFKQYWFEQAFSDKEVISPTFLTNMNRTFKAIRPFFDYMSEVLTTNLDGELLI